MKCISGSKISTNNFRKNIQQAQLRSVSESGRVPLTKIDYHPHRTTIHNYAALIVREKNISITTSETPNTCTCYTAENSFIYAMALLCVISTTRYEVVSETSSDIKKDTIKDSFGVKKLYKVVTKIYGNLLVFTILPELILSMYDTVNYIFGVKGSDNGSFRLVASKENTNAGT